MNVVRAVGIVLAGGRSRRFGRDKALVEHDGETLAGRAARRLGTICPETAVADRGRCLVPSLPSLPDGPGAGPAAGILGAAARYPGRDLLVLACDLPLVPTAALRALAASSGDWVVPRHERGLEPLCACYRPPALDALARRVATGDHALHRLAEVPELDVRTIEGAGLVAFGDPAHWLLNVNRPSDLSRLAGRVGER